MKRAVAAVQARASGTMDTFLRRRRLCHLPGRPGYFGVPQDVPGHADARGAKVREQLDAAANLRKEAEALLKDYEAKRAAAEKDAQQ